MTDTKAPVLDLQEMKAKLASARGGRQDRPPKQAVKDKKVAKAPSPPSDMCKERKALWRKVSKELSQAGVITSLDQFALRKLVEVLYHNKKLWAAAAEKNYAYTSERGKLELWPEMSAALRTDTTLIQLFKQFGMTPESRSRMRLFNQSSEDPFAGLMNRLVGLMEAKKGA